MELDHWITGLPWGGGIRAWVILLVVAVFALTPPARWIFRAAGRAADFLASRPGAAVLTIGAFAFAVTATISLRVDFPEPAVHDEFSYVLAADTFARGRLTNPKHPLWEFFETIYVIHEPTYQSKYPPAQGLMLAIGIAIVDEPMLGVWLSSALACSAITWMLLAWTPGRWAVAGGFIAALHAVMLQWNNTLWGGAIAFAGGALVLGAVRRLWNEASFKHGIILALGALILANSRPYEGLLLCIAVGVVLLPWAIARLRDGRRRMVLTSLVLPSLLILIPGALWMAYFNFRVTGNPMLSPYLRHDQSYGHTPHFFFQDLRPPKQYSNLQFDRQYGQWEPTYWERQQTFVGWLREIGRKNWRLGRGFFQPLILLVPLIMLPHTLRRHRWMQLALAMLIFFIIGTWGITWNVLLHYAAPAAPLALVLLVSCMSEMAGRGGVWRITLQVTLALFLLSIWPTFSFIHELQTKGPQMSRAKVVNTILQGYPNDKHLFVIHNLPDLYTEWVYNGADIDSQRIVWARDLGPEKLPRLLSYYKNRRAWMIDVGEVVRVKPLGWKLPQEMLPPGK
jgi:hypothetical protein